MRFRQLLPLFGARFLPWYIIWGSTYFVIRIGVGKPAAADDGRRTFSLGGDVARRRFLLLRGEKLPPLRARPSTPR